MPNYDFKCKDCGEVFQKNVSIAEKDQVTCPNCQQQNLQQVYGQFGIKISKKNAAACQGCPGRCAH